MSWNSTDLTICHHEGLGCCWPAPSCGGPWAAGACPWSWEDMSNSTLYTYTAGRFFSNISQARASCFYLDDSAIRDEVQKFKVHLVTPPWNMWKLGIGGWDTLQFEFMELSTSSDIMTNLCTSTHTVCCLVPTSGLWSLDWRWEWPENDLGCMLLSIDTIEQAQSSGIINRLNK